MNGGGENMDSHSLRKYGTVPVFVRLGDTTSLTTRIVSDLGPTRVGRCLLPGPIPAPSVRPYPRPSSVCIREDVKVDTSLGPSLHGKTKATRADQRRGQFPTSLRTSLPRNLTRSRRGGARARDTKGSTPTDTVEVKTAPHFPTLTPSPNVSVHSY